MAGLSNSLCISQYTPSIDLMYDGELPVFNKKEDCLKKIKLYLNDKNLLKEATEKFNKKSLEYEDSKYIDKIGNFLETINIKEKEHFSTPIWYNQIFINQSMRLRFKRTFMKTSSALIAGAAISPLASCTSEKTGDLAPLKNWAGNLTYGTKNIHYPTTVEEISKLVKKNKSIKTLVNLI